MNAEQELVADAVEIIQAEHDQMVDSFRVRSKGSDDYGKITDKTAKRDIDRMSKWLERARRFLQ